MDIKTATNSAIDCLRSGDLERAEHIFREILKVQPNNVSALHFTGLIHYRRKEYESSIRYIQEALRFGPDYADAYNNLGIVLQEIGQLDEAIPSYQKAIQLNPNFDRAYYNLGTAFKDRWRINEAIAQYQKALQLNPYLFEAYNNMGLAFQDQGRLDEAEACYRKALQIKPDFPVCHSNLLLLMNYNSRNDVQAIFSEHLRFAKQFAEPLASAILPHTNDPTPGRRLKIGYVSPDFRRHSVNYFIEPVLTFHNHEQCEIFCYSDILRPDTVTERLTGYADHWRNIFGISDEEVAAIIRKDQIDILIDLAGHTAYNRMLMFARKPAPVQISWIGYPPTTGLSTIDYKIVDNFTNPSHKTEQLYTEKLLPLPESFVVYLPDKDSPEISPLPALSKGHITFSSFNNFAKITQEVVTLWAKILDKVPDSHMLMKWKSFSDTSTHEYAINMFMQRGIDAGRIILQSSEPPPEYLLSYSSVDIGLDTFPFNGLTTTCEALWMGIPVITLAGTSYASRGGVSFLSNLGLSELIAETADEYVSIAVNLATDLNRLQALRKNLRNIMLNSPLLNHKRFSFHLEKLYHSIWDKWCRGYSV